jgi:hypothetical protein
MRSSRPDVLEAVVGRRTLLVAVAMIGALTIGVFALVGVLAFGRFGERGASSTRRSPRAVVEAVRDLARVETIELHIERAIDLADRQSVLAGSVGDDDALFIVVAGEVTIGVDFEKLEDDDVAMDERTEAVRVRLPRPEILEVHLDDGAASVYRRSGAARVERVAARARAEATAVLERAARDSDAFDRAKRGTERQARHMLARLGIERVEMVWSP